VYVFQLRARLCVLLLEFSLPSFLYGCVRHFQLIVCKLLRVVRRGEDTVRVESSQRNLFIVIIISVSILKKKKTKKTKKTKKKKNKHVLYLNFLLFQDERRLLHVSFEHCFLTDWALA
jgi:hypothetical protein